MEWLARCHRFFGKTPALTDLDACLVDVRSADEFKAGHLPRALSLPLEQLRAQAHALLPDPEAAIVVYCHSGVRSALARRQLIAMGYVQVSNGGGMARLRRRLARAAQAAAAGQTGS